jgi:hypothetical protein
MATVWYAVNSSVNIDSANEWNDAANGSGNFLTWANLAADDTLRANGKTAIAINVDFTAAQIDTLTNGGGFTVATARTISADIQAGTSTCITTSGSGYTLTINGDVTGSATTDSAMCIKNQVNPGIDITVNGTVRGGSGTGTWSYGLLNSYSCTVTVTTAIGGSAANSYGIYHNGTSGTVNVTNVTGGSAANSYGVYSNTNTVNVTNVTGGSAATAYGIILASAGYINISGSVTAGSATGCNAVYSLHVSSIVTVTGDIIDNQYAAAICAKVLIINQGTTNYYRVYTGATTRDMYYDLPDVGNVTEDDTVAGATGTYKEATEAEVQSGVHFGASSALTGSYAGGGGGRPEFRGGNL